MTDPPWTDDEVDQLRAMQAEGLTPASIAGALPGRSLKAVRRKIERMAPTRPAGIAAPAAPPPPPRPCSVCGAPVGQDWWTDWRRCPSHRNQRNDP